MYKRTNIRKSIALGALALTLAILALLKLSPLISEKVFAGGISRIWILIFGNVFGVLPFSVYELLLALALIYITWAVVSFIVRLCKKNNGKALCGVLSFFLFCAVFANVYFITAGFSYNRSEIPVPMSEESVSLTDAELIAVCEYYINEYNAALAEMNFDSNGNVISPFESEKQLTAALRAEFSRLDNGYYNSYVPKAKGITLSGVMTDMSIRGVFFAPTGEVNYNKNMYDIEKPVTILHEMAHGVGVMVENEANLLAYYLAVTSEHAFFRLAAYDESMFSLLQAADMQIGSKEYERLNALVSDKMKFQNNNILNFWNSTSFLGSVTGFFNDFYLKLMGVGGTDNYHKPPIITDSGEQNESGETIYDIEYNNVQRMYLQHYSDKTGINIGRTDRPN